MLIKLIFVGDIYKGDLLIYLQNNSIICRLSEHCKYQNFQISF